MSDAAAVQHAIDNILDRPNADPDDDAAIVARYAARLIAADVRVGPDEGLRAAARTVCRLWFNIAGIDQKSYAAMYKGDGDEFTEAMWSLRAALDERSAE